MQTAFQQPQALALTLRLFHPTVRLSQHSVETMLERVAAAFAIHENVVDQQLMLF